jgi:membrane associated rhomboid family serine protease
MASAPATNPTLPGGLPLWPLLLVIGVLAALSLVRSMADPDGRWGLLLRRRLVLGVPWGTLLTITGVAAVYLFVQGGLSHPRNPLVMPFRAWSYFYPLGVLLSGFSHGGLGHVTGNLLGTLTFAPIVEYAWGHFPQERGQQSFATRRTNPLVRILAVPAVSFVVGLLSGIFSVGPVIGFSGVVFAFAGFALVRYPVLTVIALAAGRILNLLWTAFRNPVATAESSTRFVTPWWANISIQGHLLGLFIGVVLGGMLVRRRDQRQPAGRLFFATVAFTVFQSLWALYWFRGGGRFVLFRAAGVVFVLGIAILVTGAFSSSDGILFDPPERLRSLGIDRESLLLRRREAAVGLVIAVTIAVAVAAVPISLITIDDGAFDRSVTVRDYEVTYAEDVPDRYTSFINVSLFGETTQLNTSGVIVVSERRHIFRTAVQKAQLSFAGRKTVVVGGLGWRETVVANRTGWSAVGNGSVYKVFLRPRGGDRRLVFTADPVTVEPRIRGARIRLTPTADGFGITVRRNNRTVGSTPIPGPTNVTTAGIIFNRTGNRVYALANGTRVRIANRDRGRNQR